VRELRSLGSVRGVYSNVHSYRECYRSYGTRSPAEPPRRHPHRSPGALQSTQTRLKNRGGSRFPE
jgi:hypothetical protein